MADTYSAFEISPVPVPGPDAVPPEPYRGIYGMPMFVTVPTPEFAVSVDFWSRGLGFIELFSAPGQVTHLRRWAFQDVLLVPGERPAAAPVMSVSFSCVLSQIEQIAAACEELRPGSTAGPRTMPWGSVELEITTPEHVHVIMTAAQPYDPDGPQADYLDSVGIPAPGR
ncbi:hypothetical protein GCM10027089_49750 [Nocardia thraciensis]